jgi:mannose-6-phosphate isomerase-like protein (cupin superfamily)
MIRRGSEMRSEVREEMRGGAGAVTIQHCFEKTEFTAQCRLCARLVLPPGAGIGAHEHATEDEVFIVTAGSGLLDDGSGEVRVSAGDAILTGNGESHAIRNDGDENLEIVAVIMCYPQ